MNPRLRLLAATVLFPEVVGGVDLTVSPFFVSSLGSLLGQLPGSDPVPRCCKKNFEVDG